LADTFSGLQRQVPYFCHESLGSTPIRQNGRLKPLLVHAQESIKYLSGKRKVDGFSSVMSYCLLSTQGLGLAKSINLKTKIHHIDLVKELKLEDDPNLPFDKIEEHMGTLRRLANSPKSSDSLKKSAQKLLGQYGLYKNITSADNWVIPALTADRVDWIPVKSYLRKDLIQESEKQTKDDPFYFSLIKAANSFEKTQKSTHRLEFHYRKANLAVVALVLTLIALAALTLLKSFSVALVFCSLTLFTQTALIIIRVMISGRAPITNMYETVMFSGYGALFLAMIVGHFKKEKVFIYLGLAYNLCTLMMMNLATSMLSQSISPLVPVLRDNFWLSTHVTTIIMSYGALALSWILANTILIKKRLSKFSKADETYYSGLIYTCLKYGTIMLGAGILLGGVWADYSWGRFWGWDPKETWSLIAFIIYMAILHGRNTTWISNKRFVPFVAAAFMSIMMAWFGVNYILASGLHSYGFSEGGAIFLGSFFLAQITIIAVTYPRSATVD
jgi:cytochrome c-type biogenesis protein CcsB